MPSDRPPPEPSGRGSDPAGRRRPTGAVRDGTLAFALVLGAFVAYALGAPATYRATAVVGVETAPGFAPVSLPGWADSAQRLRRAALDPELVASLAKEERPVGSETGADVIARISSSLSVESSDGRSFSFSETAGSPERAQRVVNRLAEQAAKRATQVLDPQPPAPPEGNARAKDALFDFLAAHPDIASEPAPAPVKQGPDALVLALRAERTRIEAKLAQPGPSSENPYDPFGSLEDPERLKRRLKEIDTALDARSNPKKTPATASSGSSTITPADRAEWQRLLKTASESKGTDSPATAAPRLRVTLARAAAPRLPVEPNRPHVVLLGVLFASLAGVLAGILRSVVEARAVRRYGMATGAHARVRMPATTLRISREELPKPNAPHVEPPPTPIPAAGPTAPMTPIPPAPRLPTPITPIPPAPIAPAPITPIPPAPIAAAPITPIPPAPIAAAPMTPIPPAPIAPAPITPVPPKPAVLTSRAPAALPSASSAPIAAIPIKAVTPPPPPPTEPIAPIVVQGPTPAPASDGDGPPTTQAYGEPGKPARRNAARRTTKIYGTPPTPDLKEEGKTLRTTQAYGAAPAAVPPHRAPVIPHSATPIPAEVLPPDHRSSTRPPATTLTSSSVPPAVAPSPRTGAPLAETGYSYVQTPIPAPPDSIPQTPYPRRSPSPPPRHPSPPPRTHPYGSIPPVQAKKPPSDPPAADPNQPKTPLPPAPALANPPSVVRTHAVISSWRPETSLDPSRRKTIASEVLTLALERCFVLVVTGVRGAAKEKSAATAELALALAEAKHPRILLVESDFQFPQVQKWLKLEVPLAAGFSQQLRARVQSSSETRWHVVECKPSLHVLAEGLMRSPGLLLSSQFERAIEEFRGHYDVVLIDAPAPPSEAEARALFDVVDGAIVLGPSSRATEVVDLSKTFSGKALLRAVES